MCASHLMCLNCGNIQILNIKKFFVKHKDECKIYIYLHVCLYVCTYYMLEILNVYKRSQ